MGAFKITPFDGVAPATEKEISAFESEIGHRLPTDYRNFLLTSNGGQTSHSAIQVERHPYSHGYVASVRLFYSLSADAPPYASLYAALRSPYFKLPQHHVAITDSHGNLVTIDVSDPTGPVYYFDHEIPDESDLDENDVCQYKAKHAILLAANFDDLLKRLTTYNP